VNTVMNMRFP